MSNLAQPLPQEQPLTTQRFRQVMGRFATGVTVITTTIEDQVYGMTARDILTGGNKISIEAMPEGVRVFPETLSRYSTRK